MRTIAARATASSLARHADSDTIKAWNASPRNLGATALVTLIALAIGARQSAAQSVEPVVQHGHPDAVVDVAFSPSGQLVASGGSRGSVLLWDAATGVQLKAFQLGDNLGGVAFSPDGRWLLASQYELKEQVQVFDLSRLRYSHTIMVPALGIRFTPDGRWLLLGDYDGVRVVEFASARIHATVRSIDPRGAWALSPDGASLYAPRRSDTKNVVDLLSIPDLRPLGAYPFEGRVSTLALNRDGSRLAVVDIRGNDWWISQLETASGRTISSFEFDASGFNPRIAYTADDAALLVADEEGMIRRLHPQTGREIGRLTGHVASVNDLALSPSGTMLASGASDRGIILWDLRTSTERARLIPRAARYTAVEFCGQGRWLVLAPVVPGFPLELWDTRSGAPGRMMRRHEASVHGLECRGPWIASTDSDGLAVVWNVDTGSPVDAIDTGNSGFSALAVSGSGHRLALAADGQLQVHDFLERRLIRQFGSLGTAYGLAFVAQDRALISADLSYGHVGVRDWDIDSGALRRELYRSPKDLWPSFIRLARLATSRDGRLIAAGDISGKVRLWRAGDGALMREWQVAPSGVGLGAHTLIEAIDFSPDGSQLAFSDVADRSVRIWDVAAGEQLAHLVGHADEIVDLAYSPDGATLASCSNDFTCRLWSSDTGEQLLTLVRVLEGDDWISISSQGFFDGTQRAWQLVPFRLPSAPLDLFEPEQFFNQFYQPGLLADVLAEGRPMRDILLDRGDSRASLDISQYRYSKLPRVSIVSPGATVSTDRRELDVTIMAEDTGSGLRDLRVFRNNSLVHFEHGDLTPASGAEGYRQTVRVKLVAGRNEISAYAFNTDGLKSKDATITVSGMHQTRTGTAYILAIGVNRYDDPSYDLNFAVNDANAISRSLENSLGRLADYERIVSVRLLDEEATKANIQLALNVLSGRRILFHPSAPAELRKLAAAEPEDALIVFFAGHGTAEGDRYYLIPHDLGIGPGRLTADAAGRDSLLDHSLSDRELEAGFEKIDAGEILLIIDACQSGQALEADEIRRGPMNSRGLAQLAYEKGMHILAAAQSHQAALEFEKLGHGLLTYTLIEQGLKRMAADNNPRDNRLTVREWLDYAIERVPYETSEARARYSDRSERGVVALATTVSGQAPRAYYRREISSDPWIVATQ